MRVECGTDIGSVRQSNQDSCDCGVISTDTVWGIVCDGMGGANGGDVASSLAVEAIRAHLLEHFRPEQEEQARKNLLMNAVMQANETVYKRAKEEAALRGMGTTAVVLLAEKDVLYVAHVGDSRAYLIQMDDAQQITKDHSYVQNLVDMGLITQEEADVHPKRNVITRVIGVHEAVECDCAVFPFPEGSSAIACTDGLSSYVSKSLLLEYSKQYDQKQLIKKLIAHANEAGGSDNITVISITR